MAPSPAAGKSGTTPQTPTKSGKNPASSATPKLSDTEQAGSSVKSATSTPRPKAPKLGARGTPKGKDSPKLPPRPTEPVEEEVKEKAEEVKEKAEETKEAVPETEEVESEPEEKIGTKDNEDDIPGKIQGGNETGAESSIADTTEDPEESAADIDDGEEAVEGAEDTVDDTVDDITEGGDADTPAPETGDDGEEEIEEEHEEETGGPVGGATKSLSGKAAGAKETAEKTTDDISEGEPEKVIDDGTGDVTDAAEDVASEAEEPEELAEDIPEDVEKTAEEPMEDVSDVASEAEAPETKQVVNGVKHKGSDAASSTKGKVPASDVDVSEADEAVDDVKNKTKSVEVPDTDDVAEEVEETAEDAAGDGEDAVDDAEDGVDDAEDAVSEYPADLSILKGLIIGETGEIYNKAGEQVGTLDEGDPEDLAGMEIGDDGEILDEDGDVVGRCSVLPEVAKKMAKEAEEKTAAAAEPTSKVNGIKDAVADEPDELADKADELEDEADELDETADELPTKVPDLAVLDGLKVGEGGEIKDATGKIVGKITEGDPEDFIGQPVNEKGEVVDEEGDAIGRAEVVPAPVAKKTDKLEEEVDTEADKVVEAKANQVVEAKADLEDAKDGLVPDSSIFAGKKLTKKGTIIDEEGEVIGKLVEGNTIICAGKTPNEDGEILDKDGKVIGKVEVVEGEAAVEAMKELNPELVAKMEQLEEAVEKAEEAAEEAKQSAAAGGIDMSFLEGFRVNKKGEVINEEGEPIAKLSEGVLSVCAGQKLNDKAEVVDKEGKIVGKVSLVPTAIEELQEATKATEGTKDAADGAEEAAEEAEVSAVEAGEAAEGAEEYADGAEEAAEGAEGAADETKDAALEAIEDAKSADVPSMGILEGLKINKKGEVLDEDGDVIARLGDNYDIADCKGKKLNANGEVFNRDGEVVGKVELVGKKAEEAAPELPPLSILDGLKVNKNGEVLNEDGDAIARLAEGYDIADCKGKKLNGNGEVFNRDGDLVGKVELIPAAFDIPEEEAPEEEAPEEAEPEQLPELPPIAILDGKKVSKNGEVLNEDGEVIAKLAEGYDIADVKGKTVNANGEVLNKDGDVIGVMELVPESAELVEEEPVPEEDGDQLPPLAILEGLKVNKYGKIVDNGGKIVGELIEGDAKKISKAGISSDAEGQFWDNKGHVIGKAQTVPREEDDEEEAPFAGLEGLIVVKDGWIEDENQNRVGKIVEGDHKKLVGRSVDEDGDIIDKRGNVVGHAERYEEPEEEVPEEVKVDMSMLAGLSCNKQGNVVGPEGVPIARLVEGNPKELAGRKIDGEGRIWNDQGEIIGRCEMIPPEQREAKPEGPFAGLEGVVVGRDGWVIDEEENVVGQVTEGDWKKLIGRAVDEDGDIIDKHGNVKGHAERYEEPEEEKIDLSSLEGLTCNKQGNVIGPDGVPIGRLVEGNPKELSGRKIDAEGQIWGENGKVVGRCELIPPEQRESKPEGPFGGLEGVVVGKDGWVIDEEENIVGKVVEGDWKKLIGRSVDEDGDIIDRYGNIKGHAERYEEPEEEKVDLTMLTGLTCNKQGNVIGPDGVPVARVIEGNPKELSGKRIDGEGQIWGDDGKVAGRVQLIPSNERESKPEGPFGGLEGVVVGKDGWVIDEEENVVGQVVEGDWKKLIGRSVDEDGDIIDRFGNIKGHAERYEPPEEEKVDLSILNGLTCNKEGNVIYDGIPIARLVEGNAHELAGKRIDPEGQIWGDDGKVVGRCQLIPPNERESKPEGPFAGLEGLVVVKDGFVEDADHNIVGKLVDGDPKKLVGRKVDEEGDIIDKFGNLKGHAEPYEVPEEEEVQLDLSALAGKTVNKHGKVVDEHGTIFGQVIEGDPEQLVGCKTDGEGNIWSPDGKVIGKAGLIPGGKRSSDGPFSNFESTIVDKEGLVRDALDQIVGRVVEGDPKKLVGRKVDDDGDILDKDGNTIGRAERWEPEEKEREISPMSGLRVNREGEVRDKNGDIIGRLTDGNLLHCIGKEINDNGDVVDQDGNKLGECTLLENIPEAEEEPEVEEEGLTDEERKALEEQEIAKKIGHILQQTLEKMEPICKTITEHVDKADRTPREELDEEELVNQVKPLIEEGSKILTECNGSIRGLDPDGHIAANAKARQAAGEASPEEARVAELLKELTTTVVKTIDNAKKRIADMPHARKKLNPLWGLLTEPLFQILAAVGLLLVGVLGLVGKLLSGLGLGGLVNGLLGGLGVNKLLNGLGLGIVTESLTGKKRKPGEKKGGFLGGLL